MAERLARWSKQAPAKPASALFEVVYQRYLTAGIAISSSRGVGTQSEILSDTDVAAAMLDRLTGQRGWRQLGG